MSKVRLDVCSAQTPSWPQFRHERKGAMLKKLDTGRQAEGSFDVCVRRLPCSGVVQFAVEGSPSRMLVMAVAVEGTRSPSRRHTSRAQECSPAEG